MTKRMWPVGLLLLSPVMLLTLGGCNKETPKAEAPKGDLTQVAEKGEKQGDDHSGWWCDEHGVPEAVCGQCSGKVAAECKKKGDWCKEHDRPESQCFICHPELKEKFAAQYRAKYGKEPPPTEDDEKGEQKTPKSAGAK